MGVALERSMKCITTRGALIIGSAIGYIKYQIGNMCKNLADKDTQKHVYGSSIVVVVI